MINDNKTNVKSNGNEIEIKEFGLQVFKVELIVDFIFIFLQKKDRLSLGLPNKKLYSIYSKRIKYISEINSEYIDLLKYFSKYPIIKL